MDLMPDEAGSVPSKALTITHELAAEDLILERRLHLQNDRRWPEIAPHSCFICQQFVLDLRSSSEHGELQLLLTDTSAFAENARRTIDLTLADLLAFAFAGCAFFRSIVRGNNELVRVLEAMEASMAPAKRETYSCRIESTSAGAEDTRDTPFDSAQFKSGRHAKDTIVWKLSPSSGWHCLYLRRRPHDDPHPYNMELLSSFELIEWPGNGPIHLCTILY
jgi:hypothetical protein